MGRPRKPKLIVIVGPTASGKSELAIKLAKKISGEIISADSRQIYRGLDIGTGKVPGKWICQKPANTQRSRSICWFLYKGIPHHCIDFVSPKKTFTVAEYKKCAETAIKDISGRGKTPIIVGGTGFWIDAVVFDMDFPEVPPNRKLRQVLSKKPPSELLEMLKKLDPQRAKTIEQKNPRRLIRAIEIAKALGEVPKITKKDKYNALWIGIKPEKSVLSQKIRKRLALRIRSGMIEEAKALHEQGLSWKRFYELGLEYRFLADFLNKKTDKQKMTENLKKVINDYARRQMVWFKKNKKIHWIQNSDNAEKLLYRFIQQPHPSNGKK